MTEEQREDSRRPEASMLEKVVAGPMQVTTRDILEIHKRECPDNGRVAIAHTEVVEDSRSSCF